MSRPEVMSMNARRSAIPLLVFAVLGLVQGACGPGDPQAEPFDLVVLNGRVMDPASGLDAIRNVGIRDGRIAAIETGSLVGTRQIDATGHVVAPGFIDLHEHGQTEEAYGMMVRDGVTAAFELEVGSGDVDAWYAAREGGQIVNYGVSVGHIPVRMDLLDDPGAGLLPAGVGGSGAITAVQLEEMEERIREGLAEGAVAVGFGSAYTPGAEMAEIERMMSVAAELGASSHIHIRNGLSGLDSTIASAVRVGAPLHVVHLNSSAGAEIDAFIEAVRAARNSGHDVTTEVYPYGAGMTEIQSALFDDWRDWPEERFQQHQLVSTGERMTRATFERARQEGGTVIIHGRTEDMTRTAVASPLTMIASDGFIENGRGHPRTSGSYSKVLGRYVREAELMPLMEALAKMTIHPARRLEARVPDMAAKGRIAAGVDADLVVFDPNTVVDRATYVDATLPPDGIPFVIVGGDVVVDRGALTEARPGRAIRAPH
jgi:N-acyl-D-aspartate/D-glutamate deacylase